MKGASRAVRATNGETQSCTCWAYSNVPTKSGQREKEIKHHALNLTVQTCSTVFIDYLQGILACLSS